MHAANRRDRRLAKGLGVLVAIVAAASWGIACAVFRTPYWMVALGGIAMAALGFWLERATLVSSDTKARKDFYLILIAGFCFFVVVGVGLVSLSALIATWYLPRL
jgi:hypothetical protein